MVSNDIWRVKPKPANPRQADYQDSKNGGGAVVLPPSTPAPGAPAAGGGGDTGGGGDSGGGGGGGGGGYSAQAAAFAAAKAQSDKQNEATRSMADAQRKLIDSFGTQRDTKLGNIAAALTGSDKMLLENYGLTLKSLQGNITNNEMAESDSSFRNISNAIRERSDILGQAASQGAGETDLLRAQLGALRNYSANQGDINRSFFDTLKSINGSISSLNADTATSRTNLFNQAESDREAAMANYYNQVADTWTQIANIENSNTNTDSESSNGYAKGYAEAGDRAAEAARSAYTKQGLPEGWTEWGGKGKEQERELNSSNRAAAVTVGPQKRAEGATLRKWE